MEIDEAAVSKKTIVRTTTATVSYDKDGRVISTFEKETVESTVHERKFYEVGEDDYVIYENVREEICKKQKKDRSITEKVIVENHLCYEEQLLCTSWADQEVEVALIQGFLSLNAENWRKYTQCLNGDLKVDTFSNFYLEMTSTEDLSEYQYEKYFIKPLQDIMISSVLGAFLTKTRSNIRMVVEGNTYRAGETASGPKTRQQKTDEDTRLNGHCFYVFELKKPSVQHDKMYNADFKKHVKYLGSSAEKIPGFCPLGMI